MVPDYLWTGTVVVVSSARKVLLASGAPCTAVCFDPSWYAVRLVVVVLKVVTTCFAYTAACLYVCGLLDHLCQIIVPFYRACVVYGALFAQDTWPTFLTRVDYLWCWLSWHHKFPIVCLRTWIVYYFNACILVLYSSPLPPPPPPPSPYILPLHSSNSLLGETLLLCYWGSGNKPISFHVSSLFRCLSR